MLLGGNGGVCLAPPPLVQGVSHTAGYAQCLAHSLHYLVARLRPGQQLNPPYAASPALPRTNQLLPTAPVAGVHRQL